MPTPKVTRAEKQGAIKREFEGSEVGKYGLKRIPTRDFFLLTDAQKRDILTEPIVLTSEGEDSLVFMTVEDYCAKIPPRKDPLKKPLMKIIDGKLFREVQ